MMQVPIISNLCVCPPSRQTPLVAKFPCTVSVGASPYGTGTTFWSASQPRMDSSFQLINDLETSYSHVFLKLFNMQLNRGGLVRHNTCATKRPTGRTTCQKDDQTQSGTSKSLRHVHPREAAIDWYLIELGRQAWYDQSDV